MKKNYRKKIFVDLSEIKGQFRIHLSFVNENRNMDFLVDSAKQQVFVYHNQKYLPFSVIDADELMTFFDELKAKQD